MKIYYQANKEQLNNLVQYLSMKVEQKKNQLVEN